MPLLAVPAPRRGDQFSLTVDHTAADHGESPVLNPPSGNLSNCCVRRGSAGIPACAVVQRAQWKIAQ